MTTTEASFPSTIDEPYEVTVKTASVDLELVEPDTERDNAPDRVEDLTKGLMAVPKSELDTEREKS